MEKEIVRIMCNVGCLQFGNFKLKSGLVSPIYFDFRKLASDPLHLNKLCSAIVKKVPGLSGFKLCGVPYGAVPLTTVLSQQTGCPMLMCRKTSKDHGNRSAIDGIYKRQDSVILVEDTITTGASVLETATVLKHHGLKVIAVVAIMNIASQQQLKGNLPIYSLFTLKSFMKHLCELPEHKPVDVLTTKIFAYEEFLKKRYLASIPVVRHVYNLMSRKRTNLVLSADMESYDDTNDLIDTLKYHTCGIKIHPHICKNKFNFMVQTDDWHQNFMIADLKLCDIESIAKRQWMLVADWADLVTVHLNTAPSILNGLREAIQEYQTNDKLPIEKKPRGVLLIAEMSVAKTDPVYSVNYQRVLEIAELYQDIVAGFVCQSEFLKAISNWSLKHQFLYFSPGIRLEEKQDHLGQTYNTPKHMVSVGTDCLIVGRGIYKDGESMVTQAQTYNSWNDWFHQYFEK